MRTYCVLLVIVSLAATACDSRPTAAPRKPDANSEGHQSDSRAADFHFQRFIPIADSRMPAGVLALDTVSGQLCKTVSEKLAQSAADLPTCVSLAKLLDPYEEYLKRTRSNDPLGILSPPPNR